MWMTNYGDDINKRFKKPKSELLEGIIDKIIVSPVMGETREGKETQRGHIFNIKFKLPIVNDGIEYKDDKNKSKGYSLKNGKKSIDTFELEVMNGRPSKKNTPKKGSIQNYSTVTDLARFLGLSTSVPLIKATY